MDFVGLAKELAAAVGAFFGFQSKKLDLKNSATMQANQTAINETKAVDQEEKAVAGKDLDAIRKNLAE